MSKTRIWIIDGHNLIFQVPHLKDLQVSGRCAEARGELEHVLFTFAGERAEEVVVVYDGNSQESNPDTRQDGFLRTTYSLGFPEEVADHRILYLAREHKSRNKVCVVTSDVRTLASELDKTVTHLSVGEFWKRYIEIAPSSHAKQMTGDYSDIEAEFLRRDLEAGPAPTPPPVPCVPVVIARPTETAARNPKRSPRDRSADAGLQEKIRLKKERGRLRQQKRLRRHGKK